MTDPALWVCVHPASCAGRLPVLSSPLGGGKDSTPGPCSRSSLVSWETPSLRTVGMCGLGVTVAETRGQQAEPRWVGGTGAREAAGRPAEMITRDKGPGDTTRRSWIPGRGLQAGGTAQTGPVGVRGGGARVAAGR